MGSRKSTARQRIFSVRLVDVNIPRRRRALAVSSKDVRLINLVLLTVVPDLGHDGTVRSRRSTAVRGPGRDASGPLTSGAEVPVPDCCQCDPWKPIGTASCERQCASLAQVEWPQVFAVADEGGMFWLR